MSLAKRGVLLINIGTPTTSSTQDVARYLNEFLMDKDVIPLPWPLRYILVKKIIVPRRAPVSASKYASIWMQGGSPLLVYSRELQEKLQRELGNRFSVKIGMRYGSPAIHKALQEFSEEKVDEVLVLPLFPHFAQATVESALKNVTEVMRKYRYNYPIKALSEFFSRREYHDPQLGVLKEHFQKHGKSFWLFTFHGLPLKHVARACKTCRNSVKTCPYCSEFQAVFPREKPPGVLPSTPVPKCYLAQCLHSVYSFANELNLEPAQWTYSFQSRLGAKEWLSPYTETVLQELPKQGIRDLVVVPLSFVSDCLETLHELGIEGKETFLVAGGEKFSVLPCINACDSWVKGLKEILLEAATANR